MKKFILLLCLVSLFSATKIISHKCKHNDISKSVEQNVQKYHRNHDDRKLDQAQPRQLKITYDISWFDKYLNYTKPHHVAFKQNSEKALNIVLSYLSDLIKTIPKPLDAMKFTGQRGFCSYVQVPAEDILQGKDSDLHLYVTFTDDPNETYLAYAGWCRMLDGLGPTHGLVNFNFGIVKNFNFTNPLVFQDMIEIVSHEITHVLGFSGASIKYWLDSNGQPYAEPSVTQLNRDVNTTFVKTPNVLKQARKHYGCDSLPGMPLENQGGSGTASSHWEASAALDEIMLGMLSNNQAIFSKFTTSLLRDTGFYYEISEQLEENTFFGKDEGCSFITGDCSNHSREFCQLSQINKCDYYHYGTSACQYQRFYDKGCYNQKTITQGACYDAEKNLFNNNSYTKYRGLGFGYNSRCFMSSLILLNQGTTQERGYCYKFECSEANQVIIKVGDKQVTCSQNGQYLSVPGFSGTIQCPEKLDEFCGYKGFCPNNCSTNGYCINSKCKCLPQFTGPACDIPVSV